MIHSKERHASRLPYGAMITKLLVTFNFDTMGESIDSSNHKINYTTLRYMKVLIKHGELRDDSVVEEKDLEETEKIYINKVFEICQRIAKYVGKIKRIITRNDDAYGKE